MGTSISPHDGPYFKNGLPRFIDAEKKRAVGENPTALQKQPPDQSYQRMTGALWPELDHVCAVLPAFAIRSPLQQLVGGFIGGLLRSTIPFQHLARITQG